LKQAIFLNSCLKKSEMSLQATNSATLREIVDLLQEFPASAQNRFLKELKLKKALLLAKKIDAAKKPRINISDDEIAEIIHNSRAKK